MKSYRYYEWIMVLFVTVLIISNIASSAKIIDWGFSISGVRMAFDAGTLLFPISYIFGDILTEVYGYKNSRKVIWAGFLCLALSSGYFALVNLLPGEGQWQQQVGDTAYLGVLGGMASGGMVLASLSAYWAGEFTNSIILAKIKVITQGRWLWVRTVLSTVVGQLVDTGIFITVASFFGIFPWDIFLTLMFTNYIFKVGIEVLMTPVTYRVVRWLKHSENEDFFDQATNFNPFRN